MKETVLFLCLLGCSMISVVSLASPEDSAPKTLDITYKSNLINGVHYITVTNNTAQRCFTYYYLLTTKCLRSLLNHLPDDGSLDKITVFELAKLEYYAKGCIGRTKLPKIPPKSSNEVSEQQITLEPEKSQTLSKVEEYQPQDMSRILQEKNGQTWRKNNSKPTAKKEKSNRENELKEKTASVVTELKKLVDTKAQILAKHTKQQQQRKRPNLKKPTTNEDKKEDQNPDGFHGIPGILIHPSILQLLQNPNRPVPNEDILKQPSFRNQPDTTFSSNPFREILPKFNYPPSIPKEIESSEMYPPNIPPQQHGNELHLGRQNTAFGDHEIPDHRDRDPLPNVSGQKDIPMYPQFRQPIQQSVLGIPNYLGYQSIIPLRHEHGDEGITYQAVPFAITHKLSPKQVESQAQFRRNIPENSQYLNPTKLSYNGHDHILTNLGIVAIPSQENTPIQETSYQESKLSMPSQRRTGNYYNQGNDEENQRRHDRLRYMSNKDNNEGDFRRREHFGNIQNEENETGPRTTNHHQDTYSENSE